MFDVPIGMYRYGIPFVIWTITGAANTLLNCFANLFAADIELCRWRRRRPS